ncbi:MAG: hypothetical protein JWN34_2349 [Bryobacterales bacterium]|nr:hypothetical protein [Bryobacterales bacterium]
MLARYPGKDRWTKRSTGTLAVTPVPTSYTGWTATGAPCWLTLSFAGSRITWTAAANTTRLNCSATLNVGGKLFSLLEAGIDPTNPLLSGVTSSAS